MNYIFLAWKTPPNIPRSPCPVIILHMQKYCITPHEIFPKPPNKYFGACVDPGIVFP